MASTGCRTARNWSPAPQPVGAGYALYDPQVWKRYGLPDYQVDDKGRLNRMGESTRWSAEGLIDTGQTAA